MVHYTPKRYPCEWYRVARSGPTLRFSGGPQDYAEAMRWFRQAADAGNSWAMNNIGDLYHYGRGVPQDYAEAMRWYRKAADAGNSEAKYKLDRLNNLIAQQSKTADAGNSAAKDNLDRLNNLIAQQSKTASSNSGCLIVIVSGSLFASGLTAWWIVLAGILPWLN
jgi:TPR repeat protein